MQKRIFVAATRQNDGKTTISLGLIRAFKKRFNRVGFIKPVGQRYVFEHGYKVDEDSVLIEKVCGMRCSIKDMTPYLRFLQDTAVEINLLQCCIT